MKHLIKVILTTFVIGLLGSFFLSFSFLNVLYQFDLVSGIVLLFGSLLFATLFAITSVITLMSTMKAEKKNKLSNWLSSNGAKFGLAYILIIVFLFSIKAELLLTIEDIKEILSIAWTILGISIAIFLIWNVVVIEYLENRKPQKPTSPLPTKTWLYIEEKGDFYNDATSLFSNITLLTINLFVLTFTTIFIYVTYRQATIFSQSITFLTLVLCTNSLGGLFTDILKPFNEKKRKMLQEAKVTNEDVDLENRIIKETEIALTAIDAVKNARNISEESKNEVISGILDTYHEKFGETLIAKPQKKGD